MTDTPAQAGGEAEFLAEVGRALLELVNEWNIINRRNPPLNTHALGLMRDVHGALALQLGVRAAELRGQGDARGLIDRLRASQNELRSELAEVVATIRR